MKALASIADDHLHEDERPLVLGYYVRVPVFVGLSRVEDCAMAALFLYAEEKRLSLAKQIKELVDDKAQYADRALATTSKVS